MKEIISLDDLKLKFLYKFFDFSNSIQVENNIVNNNILNNTYIDFLYKIYIYSTCLIDVEDLDSFRVVIEDDVVSCMVFTLDFGFLNHRIDSLSEKFSYCYDLEYIYVYFNEIYYCIDFFISYDKTSNLNIYINIMKNADIRCFARIHELDNFSIEQKISDKYKLYDFIEFIRNNFKEELYVSNWIFMNV